MCPASHRKAAGTECAGTGSLFSTWKFHFQVSRAGASPCPLPRGCSPCPWRAQNASRRGRLGAGAAAALTASGEVLEAPGQDSVPGTSGGGGGTALLVPTPLSAVLGTLGPGTGVRTGLVTQERMLACRAPTSSGAPSSPAGAPREENIFQGRQRRGGSPCQAPFSWEPRRCGGQRGAAMGLQDRGGGDWGRTWGGHSGV